MRFGLFGGGWSAAVLASGAWFGSGSAGAVPILDQVSDPRSSIGFATGLSFDAAFAEERVGQSFRPGFDGLLTQIDFLVQRDSGSTGTGVFELFQLDNFNRPQGSPLYSWTLDASAVPVGDFNNIADFTPLILDTPILVEAEERLGLTVRRTGFGDASWQTPGGTNNPYPRGGILQWSEGSQAWLGQGVGFFAGWDHGLRTYVDPDLPPPPDIVIDAFTGTDSPSPFPRVARFADPPPLTNEFGVPDTVGGYRLVNLNAEPLSGATAVPTGEVVIDLDVGAGVLNIDAESDVTPFGSFVYLSDTADPDLDLDITDHTYFAVDYAGLTADLPVEVALYNADMGTPTRENFGEFVLPAGGGTAYFALDQIDQVRSGLSDEVDLASVDTIQFIFRGETGGTSLELDRLFLTTQMQIVGDYNGDGFVSQPDLDLVLLNWGDSVLPEGWVAADQFDGIQISQNELDGVLLNWGDGTPPSTNAVPEPGTAGLLAALIGLNRRRRQGR